MRLNLDRLNHRGTTRISPGNKDFLSDHLGTTVGLRSTSPESPCFSVRKVFRMLMNGWLNRHQRLDSILKEIDRKESRFNYNAFYLPSTSS